MEKSKLETLREQLAEIDLEEPSNQEITQLLFDLMTKLRNNEISIKEAELKSKELSGIQKDREKRFKQITKEIRQINK